MMFDELKELNWDKKAIMRGKVVNKKARYNLCFSNFSQEPDYDNGKGRIYNFKNIQKLLKTMQEPLKCHNGKHYYTFL